MEEKKFKAIRTQVRKGVKAILTKEEASYMIQRCEQIKWKLDMMILTERYYNMTHEIVIKNLVDVIKELEYYRHIRYECPLLLTKKI